MATDVRERLLADSQFGAGQIIANSITYAPTTWYLGMSTTIPNDDGTNFTEPVGGSYARKSVTNNTTQFPNAVTLLGVTTKQNGQNIDFANPTGFWGQMLYYGWFDVSSGGVPQYHNPLDTGITVQSGNTPVQFAAGQLIMPWT